MHWENLFVHWGIYLCTGKFICALKHISVLETYLCTGKHILSIEKYICALEIYLCTGKLICALGNLFLHWKIYFYTGETYLCTEKHTCALKIYICALKNMSVMCSDQYICTEIFICALHIWATVRKGFGPEKFSGLLRNARLVLSIRSDAIRSGPILILLTPT